MNRMAWLFVGLGVLLVLSHGGLGFFLPLMLGLLLFGLIGGRRRMAGHYGYGWGSCGAARQHEHDARQQGGQPRSMVNPEQQSYTGETTRL